METMSLEEHQLRKARSAKLLLLFAMISMVMMFAGLTSAYLVSASRKDWLHEMIVPQSFTWSTIVILISSITIFLAKRAIKKDNREQTTIFLVATLALGLLFVFFQIQGFEELVDKRLFFTGKYSTVTSSFLYVLTSLHIAHLAGGIISLIIIIYNHFKQKYNSVQYTGIELGGMYWHFLDFLWVFLFLFLYFVK